MKPLHRVKAMLLRALLLPTAPDNPLHLVNYPLGLHLGNSLPESSAGHTFDLLFFLPPDPILHGVHVEGGRAIVAGWPAWCHLFTLCFWLRVL